MRLRPRMRRTVPRAGRDEEGLASVVRGPRRSKLTCAALVVTLLAPLVAAVTVSANASASTSPVTVFLFENAYPGDQVSASQSASGPSDLTPFAALSPALVNPGYSFSGWNSAANGTGVAYGDGATYPFSVDGALFAQWTPSGATAAPQVTITYDANGAAGVIPSTVVSAGAMVTLPSGAGLVNAALTFSGWNSAPDGSGVAYGPGASVQVGSNETLYAQWTSSTVVISFEPNGGSVAPASSTVAPSGTLELPTPTAGASGVNFEGWFTAPVGGSLVGGSAATVQLTTSQTLFAQWSPAETVVVRFVADGGRGGPGAVTGPVGSVVAAPSQGSVVRPGYALTGWATSPDGAGPSYGPGGAVTLTGTLTLYAQWRAARTALLYGSVGAFGSGAWSLTPQMALELERLARYVAREHDHSVAFFGYARSTGPGRALALSTLRARTSAAALRQWLMALRVRGVRVSASGEGTLVGVGAALDSSVEVYLD